MRAVIAKALCLASAVIGAATYPLVLYSGVLDLYLLGGGAVVLGGAGIALGGRKAEGGGHIGWGYCTAAVVGLGCGVFCLHGAIPYLMIHFIFRFGW